MEIEISTENPLALLVPVAILILATHLAGPAKRLNRLGYFVHFVAGFAGLMIGLFLATELGGITGIILVILLLLGYPVYQTTVMVYRIQDCGWNKWLTLVMMVPFINLIFFLILLFKPGLPPVAPPNMAEVFD